MTAVNRITRGELEAVVWRCWPARGPAAGTAVDTILAAADAYAHRGTPGRRPGRRCDHPRRAGAADFAAGDVHYDALGGAGPACGTPDGPGVLTSDRTGEVTCLACLAAA